MAETASFQDASSSHFAWMENYTEFITFLNNFIFS